MDEKDDDDFISVDEGNIGNIDGKSFNAHTSKF